MSDADILEELKSIAENAKKMAEESTTDDDLTNVKNELAANVKNELAKLEPLGDKLAKR